MLGAIIGDIIGSRFEFGAPPPPNFELFTPECSFTDDTICTIAIADAIMKGRSYKESLLEWCRKYRNPTGGYGDMFYHWIFSDDPQPYGSYGNGSAMRVSPVAWLFDSFDDVKQEARKTAVISHNHSEGIKGAECIACLIYWLRTCRITKDQVERTVEKRWGYELLSLRDIYKIGAQQHFDSTCMETVPMAIRCFLDSVNFESAIRNAIMADGDTDTKADITGALAEAIYEIPEEFIDKCFSYLPNEMLDVITAFYDRIGNTL